MWKYTGEQRPDFAHEPGPGRESVWDYPRPPELVACEQRVQIRHGDSLIADSSENLRVLETASPPTYYIPATAVDWNQLREADHCSFCEWKGRASYFALRNDDRSAPVAWMYADPSHRFAAIDAHVSFYPSLLACFVDGERVRPQPGQFYGGWVTDSIVGPFKGEPGTGHW